MTKKYFILTIAALLSLTASANKWQGTVDLILTEPGGSVKYLKAAAIFDDEAGTATLGNGYNACISHFEEGSLLIPANYDTLTDGIFRVEIGPMAFRFCSHLTEVTIAESMISDEGVTTIGAYAFVGCSQLRNVSLPSTLTTIGSGAFSELASLKAVKCHAMTAPTWQWNDVFSALGTKASMAEMAVGRTLYVKEGALSSYTGYKFDGTQTTAGEKVGWEDAFARIYELNSEPQSITSLDELIEFRDAVNNGGEYKGSSNKSVTLTTDIDLLSVENWSPIGNQSNPFDGTFNGDGHVIKNLTVDQSSIPYCGLFGNVKDATIYHFHLLNPKVKGTLFVGAVAGYADGTRIVDVLVTSDATGSSYTLENGNVNGGIVGMLNGSSSTIERCLFRGRMKDGGASGGIVGLSIPMVNITDCSADYHIEGHDDSEAMMGGVFGSAVQANITRCLSRNTFGGAGKRGAIVGQISNSNNTPLTTTINSCAYWDNGETIGMIGQQNTNANTIVTTDGNKAFDKEQYMLGDRTKEQLGDGWYYFTGMYKDYPIPATLVDMYMNNLVMNIDENGLVYCPVGNLTDFTGYAVIGYIGTAESLTIPAQFRNMDVVAIEADAFNGNATVKTINTGDNVLIIGERAFFGSAIQNLTLGEYTFEIKESAFEECDDLKEVHLPDMVNTIGARAFWGCDNLTTFHIGSGFRNHTGNFLAYCHNLQDLSLSSYNTEYTCQDNVLIHNFKKNQLLRSLCSWQDGRLHPADIRWLLPHQRAW